MTMCCKLSRAGMLGQVWFQLAGMGFFSNRVFPTEGLGTKEGWHYVYPVHEARLQAQTLLDTTTAVLHAPHLRLSLLNP